MKSGRSRPRTKPRRKPRRARKPSAGASPALSRRTSRPGPARRKSPGRSWGTSWPPYSNPRPASTRLPGADLPPGPESLRTGIGAWPPSSTTIPSGSSIRQDAESCSIAANNRSASDAGTSRAPSRRRTATHGNEAPPSYRETLPAITKRPEGRRNEGSPRAPRSSPRARLPRTTRLPSSSAHEITSCQGAPSSRARGTGAAASATSRTNERPVAQISGRTTAPSSPGMTTGDTSRCQSSSGP